MSTVALVGVPGVGYDGWVAGGAIPGYYPATLQDPYLTIFSLKMPTYGQMKAFSVYSMRFLRYGPELTRYGPRIDPDMDPE